MVDKVYSIKELAEIIPKTAATLRKWCERGVFPGARIGAGGDWEITQEGVDDYLGKEANTSLSLAQSKEKRDIAENKEAEIKANQGATLAELGLTAKEFEEAKADIANREANVEITVMENTAELRAELAEVKEGLENDRLTCQEETAKFQPENEELTKTVNELRIELKKKTRLLGGEAEAKKKLTKAYKEEAEQVRIQEEAEARQKRIEAQEAFDADNYPHINDIGKGLIIIGLMKEETLRYGIRGATFNRLLSKRWLYIRGASKYDRVEPESDKQEDITKAYDLTEKNKDRVRDNYTNIVLAFEYALKDIWGIMLAIEGTYGVAPYVSDIQDLINKVFNKGVVKPEYYAGLFQYLHSQTDRIEGIMGIYKGSGDERMYDKNPVVHEPVASKEDKSEVVR